MNPLSQLIEENLRGVWRFRWLAFAVTGSLTALGWSAIFALPDRYEAGVQVLVVPLQVCWVRVPAVQVTAPRMSLQL